MSYSQLKIEIISGEINSGKTTKLIEKINELKKQNYRVGGFISHPIISDDVKLGYMLEDISNNDFHHHINNKPLELFRLKHGRFFFNQKIFDEINERMKSLLEYDYIVIDEIGPLELQNEGFYKGLVFLLKNYKKKLIIVCRNKLLKDIKNFISNEHK